MSKVEFKALESSAHKGRSGDLRHNLIFAIIALVSRDKTRRRGVGGESSKVAEGPRPLTTESVRPRVGSFHPQHHSRIPAQAPKASIVPQPVNWFSMRPSWLRLVGPFPVSFIPLWKLATSSY